MNEEEKPSKETLDRWHKDPNNWVWGIFYYNKQDKRILPPKKMAWAGWTVNFANTVSIAIFVLTIIIIISLALFSSK